MDTQLLPIGPAMLALILTAIVLVLAGVAAWRKGHKSRRLGIVCPQENYHRGAQSIQKMRDVGAEVWECHCSCGCQFRWFSPEYWQVMRPSDFEPRAGRN